MPITDVLAETRRVLLDPANSFWLKSALRAAILRDPVDASHDADVLATLLRERMRAILKGGK